ncbi:MAG: 16S rRNA (adenine(1518)-N(6)/adenine(1519)-N(6))-dimethyltransferase RsmA [Holosporales bacterium]|jgi:16S rRNA (adenine1518-N6/adenine1519-N6)-dimethyltransferase|nr:16S rRNA (adenine(1518)-N(6)/adenine(1519)-N(6))-dimethyltransferase RsmA [Holosporales bacterium]
MQEIENLPPVSSVIKEFGLLRDGRRAKCLGQNFLLNPSLLRKIVLSAGDLTNNVVIEVGAGAGSLTREILKQRPGRLVVIEKDNACVQAITPLLLLANNIAPNSMQIFNEDVLTFDFDVVKKDALANHYKIKIIANLPYNIGTKVLLNFLHNFDNDTVEQMVLMFQKEVADRILAAPGTKHFGRLSVLAQYLTKCERVMTLSPGAFTPPPKVYSSLVRFVPNEKADLSLVHTISRITNAVFQARRKMLRNGLLALFPPDKVSALLRDLSISEERRPETLSVSDFVELAKLVQAQLGELHV